MAPRRGDRTVCGPMCGSPERKTRSLEWFCGLGAERWSLEYTHDNELLLIPVLGRSAWAKREP